jgi:hypothetical protein
MPVVRKPGLPRKKMFVGQWDAPQNHIESKPAIKEEVAPV